MKSAEEIDNKALAYANTLVPVPDPHQSIFYTTRDQRDDAAIHYTAGFLAAMEEYAAQKREWQLCPKCLGAGVVVTEPKETSVWKTCDVCHGAKVLALPSGMPLPDPPEQKDERTASQQRRPKDGTLD